MLDRSEESARPKLGARYSERPAIVDCEERTGSSEPWRASHHNKSTKDKRSEQHFRGRKGHQRMQA